MRTTCHRERVTINTTLPEAGPGATASSPPASRHPGSAARRRRRQQPWAGLGWVPTAQGAGAPGWEGLEARGL